MIGVTDILVGGCDPKTLHPDVGTMILFFFFLFHWKNWWHVLYQESVVRNLLYLMLEHLFHWHMFNFPYKSTLSFSWWEEYAFVKCNTSSIRKYALAVVDNISFWKHTLQLYNCRLLLLWIRGTPLELLFPDLCLR